MGEAKRKRMAAAAGIQPWHQTIDKSRVWEAVRRVVTAVTSSHAADCTLYAIVGAGLLRHLGIDAIAVAGSAAWRVGPGPSDAISHAEEVSGVYYSPTMNGSQRGALMHAWIWVAATVAEPAYVVDLTTFQLRQKARALDMMDGGQTQVDFCPDSLWVPADKHASHPQTVVNSYDVGVFTYVRKPRVEADVLNPGLINETLNLIEGAILIYNELEHGVDTRVIGICNDGSLQERDSVTMKPLRPI